MEASLGFHPHLHILVSDGCFHKNGMFSVSPAIDAKALEQIFRHKVLKMLLAPDFILFMDEILTELMKEREVHVILDNFCTHKKNEEWLQKHPNVFFHFTPTSASWLNQIEIWFGIFTRKVLRGAGFENTTKLRDAIESYINYYNKSPRPFIWKKREVKGSQLRDIIDNLCY